MDIENTQEPKEQEPVHTEQIEDIIGTPPMWIYRWGISLILVITLVCLLVSSFIQYPEVVNTQLKIIAADSLQTVSFKDSARLIAILVQNNQKIKKGQPLAVVESKSHKTTIIALNSGELDYASIIRENELLKPGQALFNIAPYNKDYYGEMAIPRYAANKVKPGQTVWVTLKNHSDERKNTLKGKVKYIADDLKSNVYVAEVDFKADGKSNNTESILLQNGSVAEAEIITMPSTIFHRIIQSLMKGIK